MKKSILLITLAIYGLVFCSCQKTVPETVEELKPQAISATAGDPVLLASNGLTIESLNGAITANEISGFKTYMNSQTVNSYGGNNIWVFGGPSSNVEAFGNMYEATGDVAILDRMIYFCDGILSTRNDKATAANGGQKATWTGNIDPIWPSSAKDTVIAQAGIEQGRVLAHMAYCAKLILEHPAIWNTNVGIGDSKGYGATYKARALKYITECNYVIDNWIIPRFVRTSDKLLYFPGAPNTYMANGPAPWNQLVMVTDVMIRLVQCHVLLNNEASRITQYDAIVQANINWFIANFTSVTSAQGSACWRWMYSLTSASLEDCNHFAYDAEGLWMAYNSGRYNIPLLTVTKMANTLFDIVLKNQNADGSYAGRVNGTTGINLAAGFFSLKHEYFYLADIRQDKYFTAANINISSGDAASTGATTARILWLKNRRYLAGDGNVELYQGCDYSGWKASFGSGNFLLSALVANGGVNDDASAIKVPPGMQAVLYSSDNYGGTAVTFTADAACLSASGINDAVSSLKVTTIP
ncbi:hypothetical protein [Pedobacter sp. BMA]|uniref:hypothetical protein n=1 Tax=Pedobacter sp. BMA TaxID=1663685 RepID=UPI000649B267|nr:hypothetical protein [Pedobacter sp. BMA]KLT67441.1 hypothetical protein AB669_01735 [Pedobacter sp. BMA]